MKTAIYIEDGIVQLVLTPQIDFEKNALSSFEGRNLEVQIFSGSFYDCRGGWIRQKDFPGEDNSIILRIVPKQPKTQP